MSTGSLLSPDAGSRYFAFETPGQGWDRHSIVQYRGPDIVTLVVGDSVTHVAG
jgi:hypothetical protein